MRPDPRNYRYAAAKADPGGGRVASVHSGRMARRDTERGWLQPEQVKGPLSGDRDATAALPESATPDYFI